MPGSTDPAALGLAPGLAAVGVNVAGVLAGSRYDELVPSAWQRAELQPGARSIVVLATGGRAFGRALRAAPESGLDVDPVDRFTTRVVEHAAGVLRDAGSPTTAAFYWQRRGGEFADFIALAEACGIGVRSRLALLLHPVYGTWLSIRAILATGRSLEPTGPLAGFAPCDGCPAPCASACRGEAVRPVRFDAAACLETSARDAVCRAGCPARQACPVGEAHAYDPVVEALHRDAARAVAGTEDPQP